MPIMVLVYGRPVVRSAGVWSEHEPSGLGFWRYDIVSASKLVAELAVEVAMQSAGLRLDLGFRLGDQRRSQNSGVSPQFEPHVPSVRPSSD